MNDYMEFNTLKQLQLVSKMPKSTNVLLKTELVFLVLEFEPFIMILVVTHLQNISDRPEKIVPLKCLYTMW